LWQLDATSHSWFGIPGERLPLLDMVDDCSRVIVGARLYPRECLSAYLDFLSNAFRAYGLTLALYFVLRPFKADPWWRYVWSVRSRVRIGVDGCVPVGAHRLPFPGRVAGSVVRCQHPDGSCTFLANEPGSGGKPVVLVRPEGSGPDWTV
jgi:hypothetical protein